MASFAACHRYLWLAWRSWQARRRRTPRRPDAGFSLVEVLVAFSVASLTLAVYFEVLGRSAAASQASADRLTAAAHAQSKLAGLGHLEPLAEGRSQGAFDETFSWELAVSADARLGARHGRAPLRALNAALKVIWKRGRRERTATYTTLRLVAARGVLP